MSSTSAQLVAAAASPSIFFVDVFVAVRHKDHDMALVDARMKLMFVTIPVPWGIVRLHGPRVGLGIVHQRTEMLVYQK